MHDITLCTNETCHMKTICMRATKRPSASQLREHFEPTNNECEAFWLDKHSGYDKEAIEAIKHQTGYRDTKTPSLF